MLCQVCRRPLKHQIRKVEDGPEPGVLVPGDAGSLEEIKDGRIADGLFVDELEKVGTAQQGQEKKVDLFHESFVKRLILE